MTSFPQALLTQAEWFPVDVDMRSRAVHFVRLPEGVIESAPFLDNRLDFDQKQVRVVPFESLRGFPPARPAWLWHTSFCGSTLLARMLHVSPFNISLREPLVLRRLSDEADNGQDISDALDVVLPLLARPWYPGSFVLIKPTHAALNIAEPVMRATEESCAIVLTSSLEDFLISHLKKAPDTLAKVPVLTERALAAGRLINRLPARAFDPPGTLAMVTLQWAAQRELIAELQASVGIPRIQIVDWNDLQNDLSAGARECSQLLGLHIPEDALVANVVAHAGRHSKVTERQFDVRSRRTEAAVLADQFSTQLRDAILWAEDILFPVMSRTAIDPSVSIRGSA